MAGLRVGGGVEPHVEIRLFEGGAEPLPRLVLPHAAHEGDGSPQAAGGDGLVGALAPGHRHDLAGNGGFTRQRQCLDPVDRVQNETSYDDDLVCSHGTLRADSAGQPTGVGGGSLRSSRSCSAPSNWRPRATLPSSGTPRPGILRRS